MKLMYIINCFKPLFFSSARFLFVLFSLFLFLPSLGLSTPNREQSIIGKWGLVDRFCEDGTKMSVSKSRISEHVRIFKASTTMEMKFESLFSDSYCFAEAEAAYSISKDVITMRHYKIDIDGCWATEIVFLFIRLFQEPLEKSYEFKLTADDELFLLNKDSNCSEGVKSVEKYQRQR